MTIPKHLIERLNEIREERGLSINDFGRECGMDPKNMKVILNGQQEDVTTKTLQKIADNLKLDLKILLDDQT